MVYATAAIMENFHALAPNLPPQMISMPFKLLLLNRSEEEKFARDVYKV